jgi:hypothetical protein
MSEETLMEVIERDGAAAGGPVEAANAADFSRAARLDSSTLQMLLALDFALKRSGRDPQTGGLKSDIRAYLRHYGSGSAAAGQDDQI